MALPMVLQQIDHHLNILVVHSYAFANWGNAKYCVELESISALIVCEHIVKISDTIGSVVVASPG